MAIEAPLRDLNEMQAAGILTDYAIGGAVAAFFYIEPAATFDLGIFSAWASSGGIYSRPSLCMNTSDLMDTANM